jgi:DNA-binding NarL/FixJ family response regulator
MLPERLTYKEKLVLLHLKDGLSNEEIASRLCSSQPTIKKLVYRLCLKMEAKNRAHVVSLAWENNLFNQIAV